MLSRKVQLIIYNLQRQEVISMDVIIFQANQQLIESYQKFKTI